MPNNKKNDTLPEVEEENKNETITKTVDPQIDSDEDRHSGDHDLDYYLGIKQKHTFWSDPAGLEQIRKDYLIYHRGISEEEYESRYKRKVSKPSCTVQPKFKQVPFKIHKKSKKANSIREGMAESWVEKKGIFKLFGNRRESESTSDSYSECESNDDAKHSDIINIDCDSRDEEDEILDIADEINKITTQDRLRKIMSKIGRAEQGVRIKEVSEGRPCDNCPELCHGFAPHPWRRSQAHRVRSDLIVITTLKAFTRVPVRDKMCLSLKQLEWAEIYRRVIKGDKEEVTERKIQKFPSRERNHAVRRRSNNNFRSHINCQTCARVAEDENR
ncbi:hypothetical protein KGM_210097 [Danaus plexippus plexippus]|uniref:Uncharacterized protein n=1 Tax=Danaus plexippus plexippus TaxID=278856 RepID=A0A212EVX4_DANPL|nr:hypothetical protein KGM_210097 [Danaus plexippus plexippus]